MMDIRQSAQYANYLRSLGWKIEKIDNCYIFIRRFPLIGSFIKIQRPKKTPPVEDIARLAKKYRVWQLILEPMKQWDSETMKQWKNCGFRPSFPSLPSKTLHINLTQPKEKIFASFSSSKRRDIKRAARDNVIVKESEDIENFIKFKNTQNGISGRILKIDRQFKALWQAFWPKKAVLLLAYSLGIPRPMAGILLLFYDQTAYYYQATSTKQGNKLAAPTLLVWEAIKLSKKKGCKIFDFEGIYDPRFPQKSWLGFTRFKKGFGGKEVIYPLPLMKTSLTAHFGNCYD